MSTISKGYHKFSSRLEYFRDDIETADVMCLNKEHLKGNEHIFRQVKPDVHRRLFSRSNAVGSRKLVLNHLRKTIFVAFLKEVYEEVTEYFRYILYCGSTNGSDTNRIVGNLPFKLDANFVMQLARKGQVEKYIVDHVFQSLEGEKSTIGLLKKIKNKLGLDVDDALIAHASPYLHCRHIFVHSDGKPDADFVKKYPEIELDKKKRIVLSLEFLNEVYSVIDSLVKAYDEEMIKKGFIPESEQK